MFRRCGPLSVGMWLAWMAGSLVLAGDPPAPRTFTDAQVRAAGLRKLTGQHVTLYTDVPSRPAVDELPQVFDRAFPLWCAYFGQDAKQLANWHVNGFLMADRNRFVTAGMIPNNLPNFLNGYARDGEFWLNEQTTDFYRRHLFLHEGTHIFMFVNLGSCGPPWYMEGLAEHLGTHRWQDGKLELGIIPLVKEDSPGWGRVKIVKDAFAANKHYSLAHVLAFPAQQYLQNEPYGWSWAAATFFAQHPAYRERFKESLADVQAADFNVRFKRRFGDEWRQVSTDFAVFVASLEYGYDLPRAAIVFRPAEPLPTAGRTVAVAADRGWQGGGITLERGKKYTLRATGRVELAQQPKPWISEANGISFRYYRGLPLGTLLAAVEDTADEAEPGAGFLELFTVGLGATVTAPRTGTLFLKINDSPAELSDNKGQLSVTVTAAP